MAEAINTFSDMDDYEYFEGISFQTDQPEHLTTVLQFTQKKGVKGAHTINSFNQAVKDYNLRIVSNTEHPTVRGVYEIVYEIPLKNKKLEYTDDYKIVKEPKTVYDSSIISDTKILEWGQQAADKGIDNAIASGKREFTETANKIDFRVYIDPKTKTVTNFFPVFR